MVGVTEPCCTLFISFYNASGRRVLVILRPPKASLEGGPLLIDPATHPAEWPASFCTLPALCEQGLCIHQHRPTHLALCTTHSGHFTA